MKFFIINGNEIHEKELSFNYENKFKVCFEGNEVNDLDALIFCIEKYIKVYNIFRDRMSAEEYMAKENKKKIDEEIELFLA